MAAVAESITEAAVTTADNREAEKTRKYLKLMDVGVLLAALVIFLIFITILIRLAFPVGTRLGDIYNNENAALIEDGELGQIDIAGNSIKSFGTFVAQLGDVRRDVKFRAADSIAWTSASEGASVHNRDAVQTFQNSRARVDFTTDNELRIGQNSLVVFRSGAADPFLERREPAAVVMNGELSGIINSDFGAFALEFPSGIVELTADTRTGEAVDFRVGINPDQSSTISIISGQADVNIAGEHYRVSPSQGLTITKDGRTSGARALPSVPVISAPNDNAVAQYLEAPPRVNFRWRQVLDARNYRLEIALDAGFEEILVDELLNDSSFTHGNLSSGDYFWRISARDGWLQGPASRPRRLSVVRDAMPPSLDLRPIQEMATGRFAVRGKTTPGSVVYVLGQLVQTTSGGEFEYLFNPESGTQSIVVEAIDAVGNITYSSQVLHVPGNAGRSD